MRIALTHIHCWPEVRRGGERYLHEVARELATRGHDVTILSSSRGGRSIEVDRWGVTVRRLSAPSGPTALDREAAFGRRVLPSLLRGRFDVVHSLGASDASASVRAARLWRGRTTVFTNLGIPHRDSFDRRPDGPAHERVIDGIDVYGCLSVYAAEVLRRDYGRVGTITPGGVDLQTFVPAPRRHSEPTLLYSGALDEPRKNVGLLLAAVARLARTRPTIRLQLSGPGDPRPLLEAAPVAARVRAEVLPLGDQVDQPERYGRAWATVLASEHEAFGLALVESLACGTPVVGLDHGALPELVSSDVGALAPPGDEAALAAACDVALSISEDREIVDRCRNAAAPFDWRRGVVPALEALYQGESSSTMVRQS